MVPRLPPLRFTDYTKDSFTSYSRAGSALCSPVRPFARDYLSDKRSRVCTLLGQLSSGTRGSVFSRWSVVGIGASTSNGFPASFGKLPYGFEGRCRARTGRATRVLLLLGSVWARTILGGSRDTSVSRVSFPREFVCSGSFRSFETIVSPVTLLYTSGSLDSNLFTDTRVRLVRLSSGCAFSDEIRSRDTRVSRVSLLLGWTHMDRRTSFTDASASPDLFILGSARAGAIRFSVPFGSSVSLFTTLECTGLVRYSEPLGSRDLLSSASALYGFSRTRDSRDSSARLPFGRASSGSSRTTEGTVSRAPTPSTLGLLGLGSTDAL